MYQIIETFASWLWSTILLSSFMLILHYPHEYSQAKATLIQCCENTDNICISFHFASAHELRRNNSFFCLSFFFITVGPSCLIYYHAYENSLASGYTYSLMATKLYFSLVLLNRFFVPMTSSYISQSPSLSQNTLIFLFQKKKPSFNKTCTRCFAFLRMHK